MNEHVLSGTNHTDFALISALFVKIVCDSTVDNAIRSIPLRFVKILLNCC